MDHDYIQTCLLQSEHRLTSKWQRGPDRMNTSHILHVLQYRPVDHRRHTSHDPHTQHHISGVGQLDSQFGHGATQWAHAEWDHVHQTTYGCNVTYTKMLLCLQNALL